MREQLCSIQQQTEPNWQLLVRDDGSTDDTCDILAEFARDDSRIVLIRDGQSRLGPAANFGGLLQYGWNRGADYVFCADQDDVWLPEKIELEMSAMRAAEVEVGNQTPLLVHADLDVVDERLRTVHPSFMGQMRLRPEVAAPLKTLLVQNFVTGCTLLVNRLLLELAIPLPAASPLHDWWLALCAAAAGRIVFLPQALVKYRQHGGNEVGAGNRLSGVLGRHMLRRHQANFAGGVAQVQELTRRLHDPDLHINATTLELLSRYVSLFDGHQSGLKRLAEVLRLGIRRQSFSKQLALLVQLCLFHAPRHDDIVQQARRVEMKRAA